MWVRPTRDFHGTPYSKTHRSKDSHAHQHPKLHPDGAGLYLQIKPGGARSWIYRFRLNGKTRDMGLGSLTDASLVKARDKVSAARALVNDGIDPIEHTRAQVVIPPAPKPNSSPTFEEVAESYMADRLKRLRSGVHRDQ